jgi:hypothetical protein
MELTYLESLKITWFMMWRLILIGAGFGIIVAIVGAIVDVPMPSLLLYTNLFCLLSAGLYFMPLVLRMALRKQFDGFRLQVLREEREAARSHG